MEWVERTDRSVEDAKDFLLDQLGVDEDEAEFEVLEEPKPGLFGRTKGQARVRARIQPKAPRAKDDRRRRGKKGSDTGDAAAEAPSEAASATPAPAPKERAERAPAPRERAERAPRSTESGSDSAPVPSRDPEEFVAPITTFLDDLAQAFGLTATASVVVTDDGELAASLDGTGLGSLIGPGGGLIDAIQELARTVAQKEAKGGSAPRLKLDVGGYRRDRREALAEFTREMATAVVETGSAHAFEPMGSVDRKTVHDTAAEIDGVETRSEGEDPRRRVVLVRA